MADSAEPSNEQDILLGSKSPLRTLFSLSPGPFLFNVVCSLYGVIETLYFSKAFGDQSLAVLGAAFPMVVLTYIVPDFLVSGFSIQTGFLFGKKEPQEVAQMFVDYLRIAIILQVIYPLTIIFGAIPIAKMFGASDYLAEMSKQYLSPFCYSIFITLLFSLSSNLMQCSGHSYIYGIAQLGYQVLNLGIVSPVLLFVIKTPIWGSLLANQISQGVFGIALAIYIFNKDFEFKPTISMFFKPFGSSLRHGIKLGVPNLFDFFGRTVAPMLIQAYLAKAAKAEGIADPVLMVWGICNKIGYIVLMITLTINGAYIPAASYAFGSNKPQRLIQLTFHAMWISCISTGVLGVIIILYSRQISSIWSSDPEFLKAAEDILPIFHYTSFTQGFQILAQVFIMTQRRPIRASMMSIFAYGIPVFGFCALMYYTNPNDASRIIHGYNLADIWSVVFSLLFMYSPLMEQVNKSGASLCNIMVDHESEDMPSV